MRVYRSHENDYTGNVKNQNVNMGQQNEQEINQTENLKITLGHNVFNQTGKRQRHNSLKKIHSQKIAILTYSTV